VGIRIRWSKATDMVFANNAVYCPESTAVAAAGVDTHRLSANAVTGRRAGVSLDGCRFLAGGSLSEAFLDPDQHDYRPKPDSLLLARADPAWAPPLDFTGAPRQSPFAVGAFEDQ